MRLEEELKGLIRLLRDATDDYIESLTRSGAEKLADEWSYNVGDLLGDVSSIGKALSDTYATKDSEELPEAMKSFVVYAIRQPADHSRPHITRLKDILEGKRPSWPPGDE